MPKADTTAPPRQRRYVTIQDAADYLTVDVKTIRRWIAAGRLTGYRFGSKLIRLDLAELDALARPIPTAGTVGAA